MTQVVGPYDLLSAVRRFLPKTLQILNGETIPNFEWYLRDEAPVTAPNAKGKPFPNPHGVFHILAPVRYTDAVASAADDRYREIPTQKVEAIVFATGILTYAVTEEDISSVASITGTRAGLAHTFVANTDYTFDRSSIIWTGTGSLPDNGTSFTVTYNHRMYSQRFVMGSKVTIRAIIKAQAYTSPLGKAYTMSMLAAVLGDYLAMDLRSRSGGRMVRPETPADQPYTETATLGRILSGGPLPVDESMGLASWFVDFQVNVGGVLETTPTQSILTVPFTSSGLPD